MLFVQTDESKNLFKHDAIINKQCFIHFLFKIQQLRQHYPQKRHKTTLPSLRIHIKEKIYSVTEYKESEFHLHVFVYLPFCVCVCYERVVVTGSLKHLLQSHSCLLILYINGEGRIVLIPRTEIPTHISACELITLAELH